MPKSSREIWIPSTLSVFSVSRLLVVRSSSTDSVTSSSSRSALKPAMSIAWAIRSVRPSRRNSAGDRLTATVKCDGQVAACRQASSSTHWPISFIRPSASAIGMKTLGGIVPTSGWCQRTSASKPTIENGGSTSGWYSIENCLSCSAVRRLRRSISRCSSTISMERLKVFARPRPSFLAA
ncbi:hypothetical protein D9M68_829600 [compost metagenome]